MMHNHVEAVQAITVFGNVATVAERVERAF